MAALRIEPSDDTPRVILDKQKKLFEISGKSMPENVVRFYEPVLEWLIAYKKDPLEKTVFNFKFIYFNTASSKLILDILMLLEEIHIEGHEVRIKWHSVEFDEDMEEAGETYAEMIGLEFEFHSFEL